MKIDNVAIAVSPRVQVEVREVSKLLILLCVSVPSFMLSLDANIVAISLPSIARSLNADFAAVEWVISAYTLTFAALLLPAGTLADHYGRKRILLAGLVLFTLASFCCGAATHVLMLNVSRGVQGVGAALLLSAALATLSHEFRGRERVKAFGFWGSVIGLAITLGPVVGGFITQHFGWQWAFYINIPVGLVIIGLTYFSIKESRDPDAQGVDVPGFLTFACALFLLTLALISGNHQGWGSAPVLAELVGAVAFLAAFLIVETRQRRPMLDLSFFRRPTYIGANLAGLAYAACFYTMLTYLPLYFQGGMGLSPQQVGLMMLPLALPLLIVPRILTKHLAHRLSGRALLTIGQVLVAVGLLALALEAQAFRYLPMLAGMLIAGCGAGILNGETAKVGMTVIPPERAGMAAGVGGTVRFSGIVIGFAALGAVLFGAVISRLAALAPSMTKAELVDIAQQIVAGDLAESQANWGGIVLASFGAGYQTIFLTAGLLALLSAMASWLLIHPADSAVKPSN